MKLSNERERAEARAAREHIARANAAGSPIPSKRRADSTVTHRAPSAPTVGRTRVAGQWESVTVFRHESSEHFALMSPEAMREMSRGRERVYGHKSADKRAMMAARAAARAAAATVVTTSREDIAATVRKAIGTDGYRMER